MEITEIVLPSELWYQIYEYLTLKERFVKWRLINKFCNQFMIESYTKLKWIILHNNDDNNGEVLNGALKILTCLRSVCIDGADQWRLDLKFNSTNLTELQFTSGQVEWLHVENSSNRLKCSISALTNLVGLTFRRPESSSDRSLRTTDVYTIDSDLTQIPSGSLEIISITGSSPSKETFEQLAVSSSLVCLHCDGFEIPPDSIAKFTQLTELKAIHLQCSTYVGKSANDTLKSIRMNLTKLKKLSFGTNFITSIEPLYPLGPLQHKPNNLVSLEMRNANVKQFYPLMCIEFANLTKLDVCWNKFTSMEPLYGLTKLNDLDIQFNDLGDIDYRISNLINLTSFNYGHQKRNDLVYPWTQYNRMPQELSLLTKLTILDAHSDSTQHLSDILHSLTKLKRLSLINCGIPVMPESISRLKHLEHLDLEGNRLKHCRWMTRLESLKRMCYEGNTMTGQLPGLDKLKNLNYFGVTTKHDKDRFPDNEKIGKIVQVRRCVWERRSGIRVFFQATCFFLCFFTVCFVILYLFSLLWTIMT